MRSRVVKVWIDVLTPKQANICAALRSRLEEHGCEVLATSRDYREVVEMLKLRGLECRIIGRHGGGELRQKLVESARRTTELTEFISTAKPDRAISFCSPEGARVAYGLGIPHYCVGDSPHAVAVCRLTVPLSTKLFTPWIIPKAAWRQYGIADKDIIRYKGLDPVSWITTRKPSDAAIGLELIEDRKIVVMRLHEEQAAYSMSGKGDETLLGAIQGIRENEPDVQLVVLGRYPDQITRVRGQVGARVILPERVVDGVALLRRASAFVGAGGTMTTEAALIGVPTISCYPYAPTHVERYLIKVGLVRRLTNSTEVADWTIRALRDPAVQRRAKLSARRIAGTMEDPTKIIAARVSSRA